MLTACIHTNFSGCQYENWSDIPCLPIDAGPGLVCCDSIYRGSKKEGGEAEVRILPGKSVRITTKGDGSGWRTSTLLSGIFIIGLTFFRLGSWETFIFPCVLLLLHTGACLGLDGNNICASGTYRKKK